MEAFATIMAAGALFIALLALSRSARALRELKDLHADLNRQLVNREDEMELSLGAMRELFARQAAGETLDPDQIREGRMWRDVREADARALVEAGELRVLDVRTHRETTGGVIPSATLIPMDELEARHHQLKRDGLPILVVCAVGVRSAAACEYLAKQGHFALLNLETGMSGWRGAIEQPA